MIFHSKDDPGQQFRHVPTDEDFIDDQEVWEALIRSTNEWGSVKAFAILYGVNKDNLSHMRQRKLPISIEVAHALGFNIVRKYERR